MRLKTKEYLIELINDDSYTLSSVDNINPYQFSYFEGDDEINSAIVGSSGGVTTTEELNII